MTLQLYARGTEDIIKRRTRSVKRDKTALFRRYDEREWARRDVVALEGNARISARTTRITRENVHERSPVNSESKAERRVIDKIEKRKEKNSITVTAIAANCYSLAVNIHRFVTPSTAVHRRILCVRVPIPSHEQYRCPRCVIPCAPFVPRNFPSKPRSAEERRERSFSLTAAGMKSPPRPGTTRTAGRGDARRCARGPISR